jgi:hypothetical protein
MRHMARDEYGRFVRAEEPPRYTLTKAARATARPAKKRTNASVTRRKRRNPRSAARGVVRRRRRLIAAPPVRRRRRRRSTAMAANPVRRRRRRRVNPRHAKRGTGGRFVKAGARRDAAGRFIKAGATPKPARKRRRRRSAQQCRVTYRRAGQALRKRRTYLRKRGLSNPGRRYRRRYMANPRYRRRRRNPNGLIGTILPIGVALYGGRALTGFASNYATMIPASFRSPAVATSLALLGHIATKPGGPLRAMTKYRTPIMIGLGLNILRSLESLLPANVRAMIGLGASDDIYGPALGEYVSLSDYLSVGATPIDDTMTMSDYIAVDGFEQDLFVQMDLGLEQDLGAMQELGTSCPPQLPPRADFADRNLGGVTRSAMRAPVAKYPYLAPVPAHSFTGPVRGFDPQTFDAHANLYRGIFSGGYAG